MRRIASVIGLPPENVAEYERLHAEVWPAVLDRLTASNVVNYSIYRFEDLLFSYMEYVGDDFEADMAAVLVDPESQRWAQLCSALQVPMDDRPESEGWRIIPEVFHLD